MKKWILISVLLIAIVVGGVGAIEEQNQHSYVQWQEFHRASGWYNDDVHVTKIVIPEDNRTCYYITAHFGYSGTGGIDCFEGIK